MKAFNYQISVSCSTVGWPDLRLHSSQYRSHREITKRQLEPVTYSPDHPAAISNALIFRKRFLHMTYILKYPSTTFGKHSSRARPPDTRQDPFHKSTHISRHYNIPASLSLPMTTVEKPLQFLTPRSPFHLRHIFTDRGKNNRWTPFKNCILHDLKSQEPYLLFVG